MRSRKLSTIACLLVSLSLFCLVPCVVAAASDTAEKITIAASAQLKLPMDEIVGRFNRAHPGEHVVVVYGSSGKLLAQIQQGAPYDIYFSADMEFPRELANKGLAASPVRHYASGRIVMWSSTHDATQLTLESLKTPAFPRISIANPIHAPYGKRAEEALRAASIWTAIEPKLVFGESVAQAAQFVQTGNAQVGIIALAQALDPRLERQGGYWLIPKHLHQPLAQGFVITQGAAASDLAQQFSEFMFSDTAQQVLTRYGYELPQPLPEGN